MLGLLPAPMHRLLLRHAHRVRVAWWRFARPRLDGVAIAAFDGAGRVLLVRHSYGRRLWALPGGGIKRGEEPIAAARREFREELCEELHGLRLECVREEQLHGATSRVHLFSAELDHMPQVDGREVIEARFFAADDLPDQCGMLVAPRLMSISQQA